MSINKIWLHNFRGFYDTAIELKPLTVLLGPNSAGKSSFGHALAAMTHAHRTFSGTPQANLTPAAGTAATWPIDLGNLDDLRTNGATGLVRVGFETDAGLIEVGLGLDSSPSLLPSYFLHPKGSESIGTVTVVGAQDAIKTSALSPTGAVGPTVYYESTQTHFVVRRLNKLQWQESGIPSIVILDGLLLKSITHERGTALLLSGKARDELEFLFKNLTYLRAIRRRPSRTFSRRSSSDTRPAYPLRSPDSRQEIGYSGEWTADLLHSRAEDLVQYAQLPSIPNTVEEAKRQRENSPAPVTHVLLESVVNWLQQLGLAGSVRSELAKTTPNRLEILITPPNQRERNLVEVGFGASQVLPILTAGLLQPPGSLFIVDLPEAHLHPRPQSDLADFFCSLALSGRFSLVETHSEMFFHRLRLRAEMHPELIDKIAVYFMDQPKDGVCCQPQKVGLGFEDELRWPVGFFQEGWEMETQINAARQSRGEVKASND